MTECDYGWKWVEVLKPKKSNYTDSLDEVLVAHELQLHREEAIEAGLVTN